MNNELWNKILRFDFDTPHSEYGFSTRLANENYWTKNFTQQAILEYKKFMYLAATSELMVSPSEIVDTVWHQHLIFTQSYQEFCTILGKQVQHLPSTHNQEDFEKFRQAKERTVKYYENNFSVQPKAIWEYADMYQSLNLVKAKYKLRSFLIVAILVFIATTIPFYFLLVPVYTKLDNPDFMYGFIALTLTVFASLEWYNRRTLKITRLFDKDAFIFDLEPLELVYLKKQNLTDCINGTVNELVKNQSIKVNADHTLQLNINVSTNSSEQRQAVAVLRELGKTFYPNVLKRLIRKPIFWNTANCMDAFVKYFNKSKLFGSLFYMNFATLGLLLMLSFIRLASGIIRDKPLTYIAFAVVILTALVIYYMDRLTKLVAKETIPRLYKDELLPGRPIEDNWQWNYFLFGQAVLATSFLPLASYVHKNNSTDGSAGNSCESSCGSSCGGCGGCGGD